MKLTLLLTLCLTAVMLLSPSKAFARPEDGTRLIYYTNSARTVEVGRRYFCHNKWFNFGQTSSYHIEEADPEFCNEF